MRKESLKLIRKNLGKLKRRTKGLFLKGNNLECPICGKKYKNFLSAGVIKRDNAVCPGCDSFERHRLLWLYLKRRTNFFQEELRLLHFAPEDVFIDRFKKLLNIKYVTTDLSGFNVNLASDIQKLPFKNNSFDLLICSHVLEHIPDDIKAMNELFRILKKNGWGIIQVPIDEDLKNTFEDPSVKTSEERLKKFGQEDHVRIYGKDFYERLRAANFEVIKDEFLNSFSNDEVKKFALNKEDMICLIKKN